MEDEHKKKDFLDCRCVNVKNKDEVSFWTTRFSVTEEKLLEAVSKGGPILKDVENHLWGRGKINDH